MPIKHNQATPEQLKFFDDLCNSTAKHISDKLKEAFEANPKLGTRGDMVSTVTAMASALITDAVWHISPSLRVQSEVMQEILRELNNNTKRSSTLRYMGQKLGAPLPTDLDVLMLFPEEASASKPDTSEKAECNCPVCFINREIKRST